MWRYREGWVWPILKSYCRLLLKRSLLLLWVILRSYGGVFFQRKIASKKASSSCSPWTCTMRSLWSLNSSTPQMGSQEPLSLLVCRKHALPWTPIFWSAFCVAPPPRGLILMHWLCPCACTNLGRQSRSRSSSPGVCLPGPKLRGHSEPPSPSGKFSLFVLSWTPPPRPDIYRPQARQYMRLQLTERSPVWSLMFLRWQMQETIPPKVPRSL